MFPRCVVFFRDGVSEGEFAQVVTFETVAIQGKEVYHAMYPHCVLTRDPLYVEAYEQFREEAGAPKELTLKLQFVVVGKRFEQPGPWILQPQCSHSRCAQTSLQILP